MSYASMILRGMIKQIHSAASTILCFTISICRYWLLCFMSWLINGACDWSYGSMNYHIHFLAPWAQMLIFNSPSNFASITNDAVYIFLAKIFFAIFICKVINCVWAVDYEVQNILQMCILNTKLDALNLNWYLHNLIGPLNRGILFINWGFCKHVLITSFFIIFWLCKNVIIFNSINFQFEISIFIPNLT